MNFRRMAAFAACAAIAAGAAGCGGSDDSSSDTGDTTATESITKAEWITQADAICKAGDEAISQAGDDSGLDANSSTDDIAAFYTDTVLPNISDQRDQIEALPVPAGEEDAIGSLTDALDQAISDAESDPTALANGDGSSFDDVNQQAQDYGLSDCGNGAGGG